MKKIICTIVLAIFLACNLNFDVLAAQSTPTVGSDNAILIDGRTGEILYAKNPDVQFPPASTTKTMTALLTLEKCNLNAKVTVSNDFLTKDAKYIDGNRIYINNGEEISVKDLLYSLLLMSSNDSAVALADYISGSVDKFTQLMNKRAKELGCTDTNFVNPNGLYDPNHKSSVKDLALIMKELIKNPMYKTIATTQVYQMSPTNKFNAENTQKTRRFWNEDKLLYKQSRYYYDGLIGGKPGYTIQSFQSFTAAASRNNMDLVVAFHGKTKTYYEDSKILFDYGFQNFEEKKLFSKGDVVTTYSLNGTKIPLIASDDYYYVVPKGSNETPKYSIPINSITKKQFNKGDTLLNLDITLNGKKVNPLKLLSGKSYKLNATEKLSESIINNKKYALIAGIVGIAILLSMLGFILHKVKVRKANNKNIYF